jgi:hypothetical protein
MPATFVIPSAFTAIDKFSGPVKNMGNALQGFVGRSERLLGRVNGAFDRLLTPLTSINKLLMGLGFYVGLFTLIRIIKNAIDIFANFEQANADLAVVMGTTSKQNRALADDARRVGLAFGDGATNAVKMQHALATLGFEQRDILKMGRPITTGAAALEGADPEKLAGTVGAVLNAFDNLAPSDTQHILDVMALSANRTALNFEKLATTLPIVAGPANAVNISFEETVALLGVLSNAGVHVATSATSLKNIFIDSAKKGHTYTEVLANIAKHSDKLVYANKQFGKRSVVSALALTQKMHDAKNGVIALTEEFKKVKFGLTESIALQRLNTFRGAQKLLNAAYEEFILGIEDGNGSLAASLTRITRVASAMLLLSTDSDQAREAIAKMNPDILKTANNWLGWLKVIGWVTAALIAMKVALMIWRGAVVAATIVQGAWSIAMGIAAASGWLNVAALRGNTIAIGTLRSVTWAATFAQRALNIAMRASPFLIIGLGIMGLVDAYNEMEKVMDRVNDKMAENEKKTGGRYVEYQTAGGKAMRFISDPSKVDSVLNAYKSMGIDAKLMDRHENKSDSTDRINPKALENEQIDSLISIIRSGNVNINLNDPGGVVKDMKSDSSWIKPKVSNTNGWSN